MAYPEQVKNSLNCSNDTGLAEQHQYRLTISPNTFTIKYGILERLYFELLERILQEALTGLFHSR